MNILVASDKFKGSLTAAEACEAIRAGLASGFESRNEAPQIRTLPVADGGDGIAQTLTDALSGEWSTCIVHNALGDRTEAGYGLINDGRVAVIEMAEASGLAQLGNRKKDPWSASTYGTGELIQNATEQGAEKVILGIGGSATIDGGSGMARALGWKFLDFDGTELTNIPATLPDTATIIAPDNPNLPEVIVACDIENPLLGGEDCTRNYGPQKGVEVADFKKFEARIRHLINLLDGDAKSAATEPGSGAAGGLGFGARVFLGATLQSGFDLVADQIQLKEQIEWADVVITGEGRLDAQTDSGKAPAGVLRLCRELEKPAYAFCGSKETGAGSGFVEAMEIQDPELSLEFNMARAAALLEVRALNFANGFSDTEHS